MKRLIHPDQIKRVEPTETGCVVVLVGRDNGDGETLEFHGPGAERINEELGKLLVDVTTGNLEMLYNKEAITRALQVDGELLDAKAKIKDLEQAVAAAEQKAADATAAAGNAPQLQQQLDAANAKVAELTQTIETAKAAAAAAATSAAGTGTEGSPAAPAAGTEAS